MKECQKLADQGDTYVVDMDLEKFFDKVCQSKLMEMLSRTIRDSRVLSLMHKYLNAGVVIRGVFEETRVGVPQGGPLSPLLSNDMLNELDKELERRGHRFARYADDSMILCRSKRGAKRTLETIIPFMEAKLFLKVNREKTRVISKYLGHTFFVAKGNCKLRLHKKSLSKMKLKLKELTDRSKSWSNGKCMKL